MELQNIVENLERGDIKLIARMTNYNYYTVWMQLHGKRTLKDKVKQAAELIISKRKELLNEIEQYKAK